MSKSTVYLILVMLVCWTALIAGADYFVFGTTVRQYLAKNFDTTRGKIVFSEVTVQGNMFHSGVTVEYAYNVNGKDYRGSRYRYDDVYSSSPGGDVVEKLRKWSTHTVYYDPKNPANSVLAPGIDGGDLQLIMFAIPCNVALAMLWIWLTSSLREKWRVPEAGGLRILRRNGKIRVRLAWLSALGSGVYALGGAAFAISFPVVAMSGLNPSVKTMEEILGAVLIMRCDSFLLAGHDQCVREV